MKETDEINKWSLGENNKKATRVLNMSFKSFRLSKQCRRVWQSIGMTS